MGGRTFLTRADFPQPKERTREGRPRCRVCARAVPPPKRTFCSELCLEVYRRCTSPAVFMDYVYERDQGICQLCGWNLKWLAEVLDALEPLTDDPTLHPWYWRQEIVHRLTGDRRQHLYEIDHIRAVALGGDLHPDNLRVVCIPCHKGLSAGLRGDLAKLKRLQSKRPQKG